MIFRAAFPSHRVIFRVSSVFRKIHTVYENEANHHFFWEVTNDKVTATTKTQIKFLVTERNSTLCIWHEILRPIFFFFAFNSVFLSFCFLLLFFSSSGISWVHPSMSLWMIKIARICYFSLARSLSRCFRLMWFKNTVIELIGSHFFFVRSRSISTYRK